MTKDKIIIKSNTPDLVVSELVVKQDKELPEEGIVQFTLENRSNKKFMLKSLKLKMYDKNKEYLGYDWSEAEEQIINKQEEKNLEFDLEDFHKVKSAEIIIKSQVWLSGSTVFKAIIGFIIFLYILAKLSFY